MDVEDYIRLYHASWDQLQETSPGLSSYEDRTLYSTWQISYDRVRQQNQLSAQVLCLWAYFDNQDLWFGLLESGASQELPWIQQLTRNELVFHSTMRVLCDYGLVEVNCSGSGELAPRGYSIHSCIHSWASSVLNQHWDRNLTRLALNCTASCMPNKDAAKWWLIQRRLLKHAARCSYFVFNDLVPENGLHLALHGLGDFYADQGKLADAEAMYKRALVRREEELGSEDMSTLKTVHKLGVVYRNMGRQAEAKQMYERALAGRERALGTEHIATLYIVSSLSILERDLGNFNVSEQMYNRALTGFVKTLGPDHTSTLYTVNSMGILYRKQGKFVEAERLARWALKGREKAMGPEHTSTLDTVESLAILYRELERFGEAEQLHLRALDGREKALGKTHLTTLSTVSNLGTLYQKQGRLQEAESMHRRALQGITGALGSNHAKAQTARQSLKDVHDLLASLVSLDNTRQAR
jgi:tetratricopeptide (TPR) repeat protein